MFESSLDDYKDMQEVRWCTYARVYKATHAPTGKTFAVKKYQLDDSNACIPVMEQLRILRTLNHPNTTRLESVFVKNDALYIVEKFVEQSLRDIIDRRRLNPQWRKSYAYQLLSAIRYLHDRHIVHCGISTPNILIENDGHVILTDFISAFHEGSVDYFICSLPYRPPEAIEFEDVTLRTPLDIWCAGCVLVEMATGNLLFGGQCVKEMKEMFQKFSDNPSKYLADFLLFCPEDPDFVDLLLKMLTIDPSSRISVADALEHRYFADVPESVVKACAAPRS